MRALLIRRSVRTASGSGSLTTTGHRGGINCPTDTVRFPPAKPQGQKAIRWKSLTASFPRRHPPLRRRHFRLAIVGQRPSRRLNFISQGVWRYAPLILPRARTGAYFRWSAEQLGRDSLSTYRSCDEFDVSLPHGPHYSALASSEYHEALAALASPAGCEDILRDVL